MPDSEFSRSAFEEALKRIQDRIAAAALRSGRSPFDVTLIAVTKTHPIPYLQATLEAGVPALGESRVQEWLPKVQALAGGLLLPIWHFIGHVQTNKAKEVARFADVVHGVDSARLAEALSRRADHEERVLRIFIQVNASGEETKAGVDPAEAANLVAYARSLPNLDVMGLMTMAAPSDNPQDARPAFRALAKLAAHPNISLPALSMGMSDDFEVAIEEGATHVRIGSALYGYRT